MGPDMSVIKDDLLIIDGEIAAFGNKDKEYDSPSNFPKKNELIKGKVIDFGLDF